MKRIKGVEIVEQADSQEPDIPNTQSIKRQVDLGYRAFLARRGLPLPQNTFKQSVDAGMAEAVASKRKREKP